MNRGDLVWLFVLCGISSLLIMPLTHHVFVLTTFGHPYLMGFIKFSILATMGELLSIRMVKGQWSTPAGAAYKAILWGFYGMCIVLMFEIFLKGVTGAITKGMLFAGSGFSRSILSAFYISTIMNVTFGPTLMATHRITDVFIDMSCSGVTASIKDIVKKIDWNEFMRFIVFKTIPYFWIPAHTITFLLPPEYRVLAAAYLSIALGAILSYARKKKTIWG